MPISEKQLNFALKSQTDEMNSTYLKFTGEIRNLVEALCANNAVLNTKNVEATKGIIGSIESLGNTVALLSEKVESQAIALTDALAVQAAQKETIESLKIKLENAEIRARSKNLIFHGIKEEANEAGPALKRKISEVLNTHYGMASASIDLPSRLGAPPKDKFKIRPVLVTFSHKSDRDKILYRKVSNCPTTVKADLPPETASKRRILGQLTYWAKEQNIKARRTDHYVEIKGAKYNHIEAKEFLEACSVPINSDRKFGTRKESPMRS